MGTESVLIGDNKQLPGMGSVPVGENKVLCEHGSMLIGKTKIGEGVVSVPNMPPTFLLLCCNEVKFTANT